MGNAASGPIERNELIIIIKFLLIVDLLRSIRLDAGFAVSDGL